MPFPQAICASLMRYTTCEEECLPRSPGLQLSPKLKRQGYKADYGEWIKKAGDRLATAAKNSELTIYAFGNPKAHECMAKVEKRFPP